MNNKGALKRLAEVARKDTETQRLEAQLDRDKKLFWRWFPATIVIALAGLVYLIVVGQ